MSAVATALPVRGSPRPAEPALPVYIRLHQVEQLVHYTNVHLHRLEQMGKFPRRTRFGKGRVVWRLDEIMSWIEARRAESQA